LVAAWAASAGGTPPAAAITATPRRTADSLVIDIARGLQYVQGMSAETVRKILETARTTFEQLAAAAPDDLAQQYRHDPEIPESANYFRAVANSICSDPALADSYRMQIDLLRRRDFVTLLGEASCTEL
jgi:hypothetical protein